VKTKNKIILCSRFTHAYGIRVLYNTVLRCLYIVYLPTIPTLLYTLVHYIAVLKLIIVAVILCYIGIGIQNHSAGSNVGRELEAEIKVQKKRD